MSDTAAAQLRRILHLIPEIADGEERPIDDIARQLGCDRATLLRDLHALSDRFDAPGGFVDGVQLYWDERVVSAFSSHFHRPMRLTASELSALELGLGVLRAGRSPEERGAAERARERLRAVITRIPADEAPRHAELHAPGSDAHLATVRQALRARRKVRITYRRGADVESAERIVCPYGLVFSSGMWYLVAYCERSRGVRFFRLDRIERAEATSEPYSVPSDFRLEEAVAHGPLAGEPLDRMRIRYSPRIARWIAERERRELDADGSLTMEHPLHDVMWGVRHALQYGPDAEVLSPAVVREELARRLEAMAS